MDSYIPFFLVLFSPFLSIAATIMFVEYFGLKELQEVKVDLTAFFLCMNAVFLQMIVENNPRPIMMLTVCGVMILAFSIVISYNRSKDRGRIPTYYGVLQYMHDIGKEFERTPDTYKAFGEEGFRDNMIHYLEVSFEGSATGETFNKIGKADILVRYKGKDVLVAECKCWRGKKYYKDAITQLITRYLPWEDTGAAVVVFVRTQDFTSALQAVEEVTPCHQCFLRSEGKEAERWFSYCFCMEGDPQREIKLAVLLFHIPKKIQEDST